LAIADTDYDFATYPVIKLEFTRVVVKQDLDLENYIINAANTCAQDHGIELTLNSYEQRFAELVIKLHQKYQKKVVLLVDEYDKPILSHLNKPTLAAIKETINGFYASVKSLDEHLKFVFITGVSKFAKVSVFSGMNNLTDISMDNRYATLCGITQQELETHFEGQIKTLAGKFDQDKTTLLAKIKHWYNGYRFEEDAPSVYNPYSLLCLFDKQKFQNYWFATATPAFLVELIKTQQFDLSLIENFEVDDLFFAAIEPERMTPEPVLLQTGYLTIVDYNDGWYRLDFPNYEVKYAFNRAIVEEYGQTPAGDMRYLRNLSQALNAGDIADFIKTLKIFFANIPFNINLKDEKYYQSLFYAIFTLLGFQIEAEVHTNDGRIDCVLQTDTTIYVIEFKLNGSKEEALQQIENKHYHQKYQGGTKPIVLLGVEFDQKSRNIGQFVEKKG
ncbi:MAG: ATP-binding protein, partial [Psychrosphaera sp.]|nr:ATP-binding protein [Psychrosphaera sp.]